MMPQGTVDDVWTRGALIGADPAPVFDVREHLVKHGPLPALRAQDVVQLARDAQLTGHGGAGFPLWRKLEAVISAPGRAIVIGNGAEGEPASAKDRWLLRHRPHLVLDGLHLVAHAVRAGEAYLYAGAGSERVDQTMDQRRAAGVDRLRVQRIVAADTFISGEESAAINSIAGGAAIPRSKPPRVIERGLRGRPTLVSNVETLALLALIARRGVGWFRAVGTADSPGPMLFTVGGAVRQPGIVEAAHGTALTEVLELAGGVARPLQAVLIGGYHGSWLTWAEARASAMSRFDLARHGATPGAGVVVAMPQGICGLAELSRVMSYLAGESAGQCGPCLNGLPRIADQVRSLAARGTDPAVIAELQRLGGLVVGRGACHHPDGSVRFLRTGLRVFAEEVALHLEGRCSRSSDEFVLPVPRPGQARTL